MDNNMSSTTEDLNTLVVEPRASERSSLVSEHTWGRVRQRASAAAQNIIPPLVTLVVLIGIWELACSVPDASLPAPGGLIATAPMPAPLRPPI